MALIEHQNICLRSLYNSNYLSFQNAEVETYGLLNFSGVDILDPLAHIEVVQSDVDSKYVHLKSRYNNKFLVRWAPDSNWISASARTPNEDTKNWACTLFEPNLVEEESDDHKKTTIIQLTHVQLQHHARFGQQPFESFLYAGEIEPDTEDKHYNFEVIDWESILPFLTPKKVAFKGDNENFLGVKEVDGMPYLKFSFDAPVAHEIIPYKNGLVAIKSISTGKYWGRAIDDYDKVVVDISDDPSSTDNALALFRTNVLAIDKVAFLNASKACYCQRYDDVDGGILMILEKDVNEHTPLTVIYLE